MEHSLGRTINHDVKSLAYGLDTKDLEIISVVHNRMIPILNQGTKSSCTGNAGIGSINTSPFLQKVEPFYSPDEDGAIKLWSAALVIDGGQGYPPQDYGSSGLSIAKALLNAEVISGYQHTFTLQDTLKAGSKYAFITGINWYSDMFNTDADGRVHLTGNLVGGHEIELSEIDVPNGKIWFFNSWGDTWGQQGRFYLTWADYNTLLGQQGDVTVLFPVVVTPPIPVPLVYPVLRIGSTGSFVKILQTELNKLAYTLVVDGIFGNKTRIAVKDFQTKHELVVDGIVGKMTWAILNGTPNIPTQSITDIITKVCNDNGVEPLLGIAVATAESSLNPKATLYNKASNSTDRGLFQWNSKYHPEITDSMAFDPTKATQLFCQAVKNGHLVGYWKASMHNWSKMLTLEIKNKYKIL